MQPSSLKNCLLHLPFLFSRFLRTLPAGEAEQEVSESFSQDLAQMVETMIAECAYQIGKPISLMNKSDRKQVVGLLDERGVFQVRKSVPLVAERLGVTQKTIYNYLTELGVEAKVLSQPVGGVPQSQA